MIKNESIIQAKNFIFQDDGYGRMTCLILFKDFKVAERAIMYLETWDQVLLGIIIKKNNDVWFTISDGTDNHFYDFGGAKLSQKPDVVEFLEKKYTGDIYVRGAIFTPPNDMEITNRYVLVRLLPNTQN